MSENDNRQGRLNGDQSTQSQPDNQAAGRKTMGGKGHRPECGCRLCVRTHNAIAQGKRPWKETRDLSKRQKRFVNEATRQVLEEGRLNKTEAAIKAGYSEQAAGAIANRLWNDPRVKAPVLESLIRAGITREFLASVVREGLQATETKLAQYEGHFTDRAEVPDYKARFKFAELGYRLHGDLTPEEVQQQAALVIQIGSRELVAGHGSYCCCQECEEAWEQLAVQTARADER